MHELSIAMALIELASDEARRLGRPRVEALHLRLGPLSGVAEDALAFSFELAVAESEIAGARLVIEKVPLTAYARRAAPSRQLHRRNTCVVRYATSRRRKFCTAGSSSSSPWKSRSA